MSEFVAALRKVAEYECSAVLEDSLPNHIVCGTVNLVLVIGPAD